MQKSPLFALGKQQTGGFPIPARTRAYAYDLGVASFKVRLSLFQIYLAGYSNAGAPFRPVISLPVSSYPGRLYVKVRRRGTGLAQNAWAKEKWLAVLSANH